MKKMVAGLSTLGFLSSATVAFADVPLNITPPRQGSTNLGYTDLGNFISNVLTLSFIIAVIAVLAMLVWGAFEWITSGGEKEAVGKARNKILNALIGLAVLAVAFALATVAAQFLGFPSITQFTIPTPTRQP